MQVFGGITGYLCRCGGEEVLTRTDHCHGPHSEACHQEVEPSLDEGVAEKSHVEDESSAGDRENHTPVGEAPEGVQAAGVAAPALVSVLVAVLPEVSFWRGLWKDPSVRKAVSKVTDIPSPGVVVRQTVVLRV